MAIDRSGLTNMSEVVPVKLYKYQAFSERMLTSLKSRTIWFGQPSRLNDPFDCEVPYQIAPITLENCRQLLAQRDDPDWQRFKRDRTLVDAEGMPTEKFRKVLDDAARNALVQVAADSYSGRGVTCFSESPLNTLLWSHYGGGHRGVCLEFDTTGPDFRKFHRVRYSDTAPSLNLVDILLGDTSDVLWGMLTKAACWSYEREWRAIHKQADTEYCYGVTALSGIYFGTRLSASEIDLIAHLLHGSPTKLYQVKRQEGSFNLEADEVSYTPHSYN